MRWIFANQRSRLKNAYLIVVGGRDFARVRRTVQATDADVVVYRSRNDLHPFERAGQYDDVAPCRVRLERKQTTDRRNTFTRRKRRGRTGRQTAPGGGGGGGVAPNFGFRLRRTRFVPKPVPPLPVPEKRRLAALHTYGERYAFYAAHGEAPVARVTGAAQNLMAIHGGGGGVVVSPDYHGLSRGMARRRRRRRLGGCETRRNIRSRRPPSSAAPFSRRRSPRPSGVVRTGRVS